MGRQSRVLCAAAVAGLGALLPAQAAIVGATGGVINAGGPGFGALSQTYDQSGLAGHYLPGVTDFDSFVAGTLHSDVFAGNDWYSAENTATASVTYDLGHLTVIDRMALWNEDFFGIGLFDLLVSQDGVIFTSLLDAQRPTDNLEGAPYGADVFGFGATALRYIRLDMSNCQSPTVDFTPSCAIGEVAFNTVAVVPVPAGGVLLAATLGGLALWRRRKRLYSGM